MDYPIQYRNFTISPSYMAGFDYVHIEYDGPEDSRLGTCSTIIECKEAINEWWGEQPSAIETFLLNFTNSFKAKFYASYTECIEHRCGLFQFDNFRPLPWAIIDALNLIEVSDWDYEREQYIFTYTTNFMQP